MASYGPGLLFLLSAAVFSTLIFHSRYKLIAPSINLGIVLAYGIFIHQGWADFQFSTNNSPVLSWFGICSNVVFLSYFFAFLIPVIFNGLEQTILQKNQAEHKLQAEHQQLEESLEQLKRKNEELEEFAYITSHDLQEPLRTMSGFLELLNYKYGKSLDDKAQQYIAYAINGSKRMKQLIIDLLELSKIDRLEDKLEEVDVSELVQEIINNELFTPINEEDEALQIGELPIIIAHRTSLNQIFTNLVGNARKFKRNGFKNTISLHHYEENEYHVFAVQDQGIGIPEAFQHQIFGLFKRLHSKDEFPGTGIGLSICKKLAEKAGGKIWVKSQEGEGSTFYFSLPKRLLDKHPTQAN
jgi:light-regulated signal transduction histidine kinase (bacteriophytochrome)